MADKTFIRITNKDIYASIQGLHKKTDGISTLCEVHEEKIATNRKWLIGITGCIITIITSVVIYGFAG